jgi:hypothetical protein
MEEASLSSPDELLRALSDFGQFRIPADYRRCPYPAGSVEKVSYPRLSFPTMTPIFVVIVMVTTILKMTAIIRIHSRAGRFAWDRAGVLQLKRLFDNFVQFSAIQPNPATGGTIVNFNSLSLR